MNLTPTPKIAPKSPKSAKRPKIWPNEKQKDRAVLPKQKLIVYISRFQKYFLTWPWPQKQPQQAKKISPESPKSAKRPKIWRNKKKDTAVLSKQKLIVYISGFQKSFLNWPRRPKYPHRAKKVQVLISSFNFKCQFQDSISSFNFKFQFQNSISPFNFRIWFADSISSFGFKF